MKLKVDAITPDMKNLNISLLFLLKNLFVEFLFLGETLEK